MTSLPGFETLKDLEAFNAGVFLSEYKDEQRVCNLVLAFAVIYNDMKNTVWVMEQMKEMDCKAEISTYSGQFRGMYGHAHRIRLSMMRELFALIKDNKECISHELFKKLYNQLPSRIRNYWDDLYSFSIDGKMNDRDMQILFERVRNKVTYHADSEEIGKGFRMFFESGNIPPLVSIGKNMEETRFYYADAAVEKYMNSLGLSEDVNMEKLNKYMKEANHALHHMITKFIYVRGGAYRKYSQVTK